MNAAVQRPSVVVIGGGYAGIGVAAALDEDADVTLVERRDTFVHNVGALRALVKPSWAPRIFLPYDRLLANGTVIHDVAVRADARGVALRGPGVVDVSGLSRPGDRFDLSVPGQD